MDHTSGAQRGAEHEVTDEQRAEWETRLGRRLDELTRELANLATAGAAHGTRYGGAVAGIAGEARDVLRRGRRALDLGPEDVAAAGPPFAPELVSDTPPHERPDLLRP